MIRTLDYERITTLICTLSVRVCFFCLLLLLTVRFALLFSFVTSFSFLLKLYKHNYIIKTYMVFSFSSYFFVDMCSVTVVLSRSIIVKRDEPTSCRFTRMETLRIFSIKTNNEIAFTYEFDSNEVVDGFQSQRHVFDLSVTIKHVGFFPAL